MVLTILPAPIAIAGPDASICEGQSFTTTNAFAGYTGSVLWTTSGSGTFTDPTVAVTTYIPGASDITAGSVVLTITSAGTPPCGDVSDNLTLTINKTTVANAGNDDATCQNLPYQLTDATATNYVSLAWTHTGQGTLTGANTLTPTYTPANGETGTITLTLTAEGIAPCGNAVDAKTLTIYAIPTAFAGADFESCDATPVVLASAMVTGAAGVQWTTSGTGTFENATLVTATYTPSQADVANGSVTLTLTVSGNQPCGTASDQLTVILIPAAHVFAGESATICSNTPYLVSDATVTGAVSVSWTHDGQGVLENAGTLNPTYIPAAAESGFVHLFVMATGTLPCGSVTDSLTLQVIPAATAYAGDDIASCLSAPVELNAALAANYTAVKWITSGSGTFNNTSILNPVYSPAQADLDNGFVEITLQVSGTSPCGDASDVLRIDFIKAPLAHAGPDAALCSIEPFTFTAATAANYNSVSWSHTGKGTISAPNALNPTYTPAEGETGLIEFTLTANGTSACGNMVIKDLMILNINPAIAVNAGTDEAIAYGTATKLYATATGGSGIFSYSWTPEELIVENNTLTPNTQILNAETIFTLTVTDVISGCSASDDVTISMGGVQRPIAVNDYDTTGLNASTLINVTVNDSDPIGLGLDVSIISSPKSGTAILNEDGSIVYTPYLNFTGNDTLTYMICDRGMPSKCATAIVVITIFPVREFIEIYNLVTPNGDGSNDTWFIRGIEDYPNNTVLLFNRWGDKVHEFKGYDNSKLFWDGTSEKGNKLPAGTFYYILKLNDVDTRTGWVLLRWNEE
jgi:gliding motility-associated-like protein